MSHKIPCEMIQDLMPLYVEHLTSNVTNNKVQEHLNECSECKEKYQRMNVSVAQDDMKQLEAKKEIDYLKKVRRSNRSKIVISIAATIALLLAVCFVKFYFIGFPVEAYQVDFIQVGENNATISGKITKDNYAYKGSKIVHETEGDRLIIYACLKSIWSKEQTFEENYLYEEFNEELKVGDQKLYTDGTIISSLASKLFTHKNPYIGDMSANGRLAMYLGIASTFGNFQNSLQTTKEPYGWTMEFVNPIDATDEEYLNKKMTEYSYILLALIENAGEISWNYTLQGDTENARKTCTVTLGDATEAMGENMKEFAQSDRKVQKLLTRLGY